MVYGCERGTIPQATPIMQRHVSAEVDRSRRRVVNIVKFCEASATNPLAPHSKRAARCFGGGRGKDQGFPRPKCLSLSSLCTLFIFSIANFSHHLAMLSEVRLLAATKSKHKDMQARSGYHMPAQKASRQGNIHLCMLCGEATSILTRARCSARSPRVMQADVDGYGRARGSGLPRTASCISAIAFVKG